jgi:hypothetical protein
VSHSPRHRDIRKCAKPQRPPRAPRGPAAPQTRSRRETSAWLAHTVLRECRQQKCACVCTRASNTHRKVSCVSMCAHRCGCLIAWPSPHHGRHPALEFAIRHAMRRSHCASFRGWAHGWAAFCRSELHSPGVASQALELERPTELLSFALARSLSHLRSFSLSQSPGRLTSCQRGA